MILFLYIFSHSQNTLNSIPEILFKLQNYKVKFERCSYQKQSLLSLREFQLNKQPSRWLVDEKSLSTKILPTYKLSNCTNLELKTLDDAKSNFIFRNLNYFSALKKYSLFNNHLQKSGLRWDNINKKGSFITLDLCPSKKPLDREVIESIKLLKRPLAIAVSGLWIYQHKEDWLWLKAFLADYPVTWVNHSKNHPVSLTLPLDQNFLLMDGRNIEREIIENEKYLIQRGITPSIFFRFPGLVANEKALESTYNLGLIPLGANAWLTKGEKPKPGSIILIHGNGNDPKGLEIFNKLDKEKKLPLPFRELLSIFN